MSTRDLRTEIDAHLKRHATGSSGHDKLLSWIDGAGDDQLFRINVYELADEMLLGRRTLLELFIDMAYRGIFDLNWEFHCPYCNEMAGRHKHLSEATCESACAVCRIRTPFVNELDGNVEVTFTPVARLYEFARGFVERTTAETIKKIQAGTLLMPTSR